MRKIYTLVFFLFLFEFSSLSQVELVPLSNPVYDYLDRMTVNKIITGYSASMGPVSRREIASHLMEIQSRRNKLTVTDKKLLDDYLTEFSYDLTGALNKSSLFFSKKGLSELFSDRKQKYLWATADSNVSFFWDGLGEIRYMGLDGDSAGKPHVLLGQLGTRIRGTLFGSVGYYLKLTNGVRLGGTTYDASKTAFLDPVLASTRKFISEGGRTFDSYEGHLRYSPKGEWLGLTFGKEALRYGTGYIDKLILSNQNSAPFDFIKLDLQYKKIKYSFSHSSIVGNDSAGVQLQSKYLVFHRLELGPFFNNVFKLGFSEMVIYSNVPVNFAFLNPISFLTSADLNTELPGKNSNNTLLGIDMEFYPVKSLSLQGSLLIDDLNFETLGSDSTKGNDNKFGFQGGLNWQNAFMLPNLRFIYEYTRLDPFVYSHREINNSYSHWNLPIGHSLNPNSDEHAFRLAYNFGSRLSLSLTYKLQRTGLNYLDSLGNPVNVGSDILNGRGDFLIRNKFLNGVRLNRNILSAEITWQPIRQYFITLRYQMRNFDFIKDNRKLSDNIFWGSFRIDY
ncbi:MAG: capsule assembly Wzi family protein [Ignavibacteria bacterium]|nr:capsule assembly Wzi family protein [Ignavibacteria bacterium]